MGGGEQSRETAGLNLLAPGSTNKTKQGLHKIMVKLIIVAWVAGALLRPVLEDAFLSWLWQSLACLSSCACSSKVAVA